MLPKSDTQTCKLLLRLVHVCCNVSLLFSAEQNIKLCHWLNQPKVPSKASAEWHTTSSWLACKWWIPHECHLIKCEYLEKSRKPKEISTHEPLQGANSEMFNPPTHFHLAILVERSCRFYLLADGSSLKEFLLAPLPFPLCITNS